jgi:hypothetical protein
VTNVRFHGSEPLEATLTSGGGHPCVLRTLAFSWCARARPGARPDARALAAAGLLRGVGNARARRAPVAAAPGARARH